MKVSRADRAIRPLLLACYPDWKGRKVSVRVAESYQMMDYWSEGSRCFVRAFDLATGRIADHSAGNPFTAAAHALIKIPDGIALVEHQIFCGKDGGVTINVNPSTIARLLPGSARVDGPVSPSNPTAGSDSLTRNVGPMAGDISDTSPGPGLTPGHLRARTCYSCPRTIPADSHEGAECEPCARAAHERAIRRAEEFFDAADWGHES